MPIVKNNDTAYFRVSDSTFEFTPNGGSAIALGEDCITSMSITGDVRTITKACAGIEVDRRNFETGTGALEVVGKFSMELFRQIFMLDDTSLRTGVFSVRKDVRRPIFKLSCLAETLEGTTNLFHFDNVTCEAGYTASFDNSATEVPDVTLSLRYQPDSLGKGVYIASEELVDFTGAVAPAPEDWEDFKEAWLSGWTQDLVAAAV